MQKHLSIFLLVITSGFLACNEDENDEPQPAVESGAFTASISGAGAKSWKATLFTHIPS